MLKKLIVVSECSNIVVTEHLTLLLMILVKGNRMFVLIQLVTSGIQWCAEVK